MKRHTKQNTKQVNGQYYTTNADTVLAGFEHIVAGKEVIDPFVGGGDLLLWATKNGATSTVGYDLYPTYPECITQNTLTNPPSYTGKVVVTNPPYLSANKCRTGDKTPYDQWQQNDYYKCHLASLAYGCDEAIEIIPTNFFCESRDTIRRQLFETHHIISASYYNRPVFDDATTGVCVIHLRRGKLPHQSFPLSFPQEGKKINVELYPEYGYLFGKDFFDYIDVPPLKLTKTDIGMPAPNTNIVVSLLDKGAYPVGLSYNGGAPIYCKPKSFTTYQLTTTIQLSADQQKAIIKMFNDKLTTYRTQYDSMFLANYMGPTQKIISRRYINQLFSAVCYELDITP